MCNTGSELLPRYVYISPALVTAWTVWYSSPLKNSRSVTLNVTWFPMSGPCVILIFYFAVHREVGSFMSSHDGVRDKDDAKESLTDSVML